MRSFVIAISTPIFFTCLAGCDPKLGNGDVLYHMSDQPFVDRALRLYSGNGRMPPAQVAREVTPVVVHLPTTTCVGLNLKQGMAGGDTTVCFAKNDGRLVLHYVNGE